MIEKAKTNRYSNQINFVSPGIKHKAEEAKGHYDNGCSLVHSLFSRLLSLSPSLLHIALAHFLPSFLSFAMGAEPTTSLRAHSPTSASLESLPRSKWSSLAACLPRRRHLRQLILLLVSTMILLWTAMFYYHSTDASNNTQPDDISTAVDNQTAQPPADTTKVDTTTTTPYQEPEWPKFQSWNTGKYWDILNMIWILGLIWVVTQ